MGALCRTTALALLGAVIAARPGAAPAGPEDEVASAFDAGDGFDLHLSLAYRYAIRRAAIERELSGLAGTDPDDPLPRVKDLVYAGARHELVPRLELGVFTDIALTFALPIVLRDTRALEFDQRAGDCRFATDPGEATCIDAGSSTTIADGILPEGGFSAEDPGSPPGDPATVFRGVNRSGLDQLELGLVWAAMNQQRDSTKPTWKIGAELHLSVGKVMRFDRANPAGSSGVSGGVHELHVFTSMARRLGWAAPFFELSWTAPVAARSGAPLDEPDPAFGAEQTRGQQRAGTRFGFEGIAWQGRSADQRVGLHLSGDIAAHFEGRAYSEMWEVFAYAGHAPSGGPLTLDADPVAEGVQALSHPGVTYVENYLGLGGRAGIEAHLGPQVRLDLGFGVSWDQSHIITFADAGIDDDDNDVVDPGTDEVNPLHAPLVDLSGHRYRVDDALTYVLSAGLRLLF